MEEPLMPSRAVDRYMVKVCHIFPTLVLILVGSVAVLALLRWLWITLDVQWVKAEVWRIWLPMLFPWIPITIWLRPKLRILTHSKDPDKVRTGYQVAAWFAIGFPLVISQAFVEDATGSLVRIETVEDLKQSSARYYTIEKFDVDTTWMALGDDVRTSGRYNDRLDIHFYFVVPIVSNSSPFDTTGNAVYWYGVKYKHSISNRGTMAEKEAMYNQFYKEDLMAFRHYHFHVVDYFKKLSASEDLNGFMKAVDRVTPGLRSRSVVLEPVKESFEERTGSTLPWTFGSIAIGLSAFALLLTFPAYSPSELNQQQKRIKSKREDDVVEMFKYLIPKHSHFMTSIILDINIVVMFVMLFSGVHPVHPNGLELMEWGAVRRTEVMNGGEWWRLLTSMFVHAGLAHIIFNVYGLVLASLFVETAVKAWKYAIIYFVSGIIASIATIIWSDVAGVGASGAIFGLFGAVLGSLLTSYHSPDAKKFILTMLGPYVGLNLLIGFFLPGIGNAAHIGGLVTGFVLGFYFFKTLNPEDQVEDET